MGSWEILQTVCLLINDAICDRDRGRTAQIANYEEKIGRGAALLRRANGRSVRLIKLLFGAGTNLIQLRMQSSNLSIELDETQARNSDQLLGLNPGKVLDTDRFQVNACRGLL